MKSVRDNFVIDDLKGKLQYVMNTVCDGFMTGFQYVIASWLLHNTDNENWHNFLKNRKRWINDHFLAYRLTLQ